MPEGQPNQPPPKIELVHPRTGETILSVDKTGKTPQQQEQERRQEVEQNRFILTGLETPEELRTKMIRIISSQTRETTPIRARVRLFPVEGKDNSATLDEALSRVHMENHAKEDEFAKGLQVTIEAIRKLHNFYLPLEDNGSIEEDLLAGFPKQDRYQDRPVGREFNALFKLPGVARAWQLYEQAIADQLETLGYKKPNPSQSESVPSVQKKEERLSKLLPQLKDLSSDDRNLARAKIEEEAGEFTAAYEEYAWRLWNIMGRRDWHLRRVLPGAHSKLRRVFDLYYYATTDSTQHADFIPLELRDNALFFRDFIGRNTLALSPHTDLPESERREDFEWAGGTLEDWDPSQVDWSGEAKEGPRLHNAMYSVWAGGDISDAETARKTLHEGSKGILNNPDDLANATRRDGGLNIKTWDYLPSTTRKQEWGLKKTPSKLEMLEMVIGRISLLVMDKYRVAWTGINRVDSGVPGEINKDVISGLSRGELRRLYGFSFMSVQSSPDAQDYLNPEQLEEALANPDAEIPPEVLQGRFTTQDWVKNLARVLLVVHGDGTLMALTGIHREDRNGKEGRYNDAETRVREGFLNWLKAAALWDRKDLSIFTKYPKNTQYILDTFRFATIGEFYEKVIKFPLKVELDWFNRTNIAFLHQRLGNYIENLKIRAGELADNLGVPKELQNKNLITGKSHRGENMLRAPDPILSFLQDMDVSANDRRVIVLWRGDNTSKFEDMIARRQPDTLGLIHHQEWLTPRNIHDLITLAFNQGKLNYNESQDLMRRWKVGDVVSGWWQSKRWILEQTNIEKSAQDLLLKLVPLPFTLDKAVIPHVSVLDGILLGSTYWVSNIFFGNPIVGHMIYSYASHTQSSPAEGIRSILRSKWAPKFLRVWVSKYDADQQTLENLVKNEL